MTEDEKDLEQKIKQYQYEAEEAKKKLEVLQKDMNKKEKKKSFIYNLSHTLGKVVFAWAGLGFVIFGLLLIFALYNYFNQLSQFDIVKQVEMKYNLKLKQISREAGAKKIVYEVKPTKWKYRKIQFIILQDGGDKRVDDFQERYFKYIIENIKEKQVLDGFEINENYTEYGLLEYKLIYKGNTQDAQKKIQDLINYILQFDKNANNIIKDFNNLISQEKSENTVSRFFYVKLFVFLLKYDIIVL